NAIELDIARVLVEAAFDREWEAGCASLRRKVDAAAYCELPLLTFSVLMWQSAGESDFEMTSVERSEGWHQVLGAFVVESFCTDHDRLAFRLEHVEEVGGCHLRRDEDPEVRGDDGPDVGGRLDRHRLGVSVGMIVRRSRVRCRSVRSC